MNLTISRTDADSHADSAPVKCILAEVLGTQIPIRAHDGWFSATVMCQAFGKEWKNFNKSNHAVEVIKTLQVMMQNAKTEF